ncbi:MAG TPA: HAMP domain-containing protein [Polyangiaceae bacterium]|nr:HAMP domain-containing protein [Polyangiaceae bacterium]
MRRSVAPGSAAEVPSPPPVAAGEAAPEPEDDPLPPSILRLSDYPTALPTAPNTSRFGLSIGQKLGLLILSLQLAIVAALGVYFGRAQSLLLTDELREKADTYAQLVADQTASVVAFDDRETAREVFDAASSDPDLLAATIWSQDGVLLHSWGSPGAVAQNARHGVVQRKVFDLPDRILAVSPVVSREGPRGALALEFTKAELLETRAAVARATMLAAGLALLVGGALALLIAQSFARRLRAISEVAERVAAGDLTRDPIADPTRDEIGSLARSFTTMLAQIRRLFGKVQRQAAHEQQRLEGLVRERTAELAERNGDMRRVLDNVGQGFLTIDRQGEIAGERSAIVDRWLGTPEPADTFFSYIDRFAPGMGLRLELGWGELVEGFLPLELLLEQMPSKFSKDGQHFAIAYKPIFDAEGQVERAVVVLSDVTPLVERERAETEQREALKLFSRASEDPSGVREFFGESRRLVNRIVNETPDDERITRRLVHTLKGIAGVFGVERLVALCHSIEDTMADENANISDADRQRLLAGWRMIDAQLSKLTHDVHANDVMITSTDFEELLAALSTSPTDALRRMVEAWKLEPTEVRLQRAARQARALAERLGKAPVEVVVESNRVRLDPEVWSKLWAEFPHLIRNAVDHGLPPAPGDGEAAPPARIVLRSQLGAGEFWIEVENHGRGVDWERVRELARERGLPAETRADLERALFADGLTTKDCADTTSGRGVGMAAVAGAVRALGGTLRVISEDDTRTRVRMTWPAKAAGARAESSKSQQMLRESLDRSA